jgi:hypothetical protein
MIFLVDDMMIGSSTRKIILKSSDNKAFVIGEAMTLTLQTIKYITKDGVLTMVLEPSST